MVAYTFNSKIQQVEAGGFLRVDGQRGLHRKLQASHSVIRTMILIMRRGVGEEGFVGGEDCKASYCL